MPALFRAGLVPRPQSLGDWLRLDSLGLLPAGTFQSRQPFSPRTAAKRMQKLGTESPAGISPANHCCWRLGKRVTLAAAAAAEPAPGPARAPTAESRGDATLRAASTLLRYRAEPHYPASGQLAPVPGRARAPSGRSPGSGARTVCASGSRQERAGESRSRAALHAEVFPL